MNLRPTRSVQTPEPRLSAAAGALILGGAHGSLAIARSLGRRGIPVFFLTHDHPIVKFSRYAGRYGSWSGPNHPASVEELLAFAGKGLSGWLLIPAGDAEVEFVARHREALSKAFRVATPDWQIVKWACDKRLTYARAAALDIPHPRSFYPKDRADLASIDLAFPLILKPTTRDQPNEFTAAKAWRVDSRAQLLERYDRAKALVPAPTIVVQELIPGGGESQFSYAACCVEGVPVASLVARRMRQYPVDFGFTSTFVETVRQDEVERLSERFLRSLNYNGLAELEFKYDARERVFKLLDFNARPWTWIGLGAKAGVDFGWIFWQIAAGQAVTPVRAEPGRAWMHVSRDLVAVWQHMRAGAMSCSDYLQSWRQPLSFAAYAPDDLLPGLIDLVVTTYRRAARRLHRRAAARAAERPAVAGPDPWAKAVPRERSIITKAGLPEPTTLLRARLEAVKRSSIHTHAPRGVASELGHE